MTQAELAISKPKILHYNPIELHPIRYQFALDYFNLGCANTWFPKEIPLVDDVDEWNSRLSDVEKHYVKYMLGFFSTAESLVANNIVIAIYPQLANAELRLYLGRQIYEEMNHTVTFDYVIKTLPLDKDEIYRMHENIPATHAKEEFEIEFTRNLERKKFNSEEERIRSIIRNICGYYVVLEGIFFFSGFMIGLSFARRQLLKGLATLVRYVLKDETIHLAFGVDLLHALIAENPTVMTPEFRKEIEDIIRNSVQVETEYAKTAMPEGILGLNDAYYMQYVQYLADRRLTKMGLKKIFNTKNPAKWLATQADLPELFNFFEAKAIDYENIVNAI